MTMGGGGDDSGSGGGAYVAADWEYNAREIARAAMGAYAVLVIPVATPNRYVSPARRNVRPNTPPVPPLLVKEVETVSIYGVAAGNDEIRCRQRTATFLFPSQTDPTAFRRWQLSRGRPVDVRYYDVTYTRAPWKWR